jgi:hypothetical protein
VDDLILDPVAVSLLDAVRRDPERAELVRAHGYREMTLRYMDQVASVDWTTVDGLCRCLTAAASWLTRSNHAVFVFRLDGVEHAVLFSDGRASFGPPSSVAPARDYLDAVRPVPE